MRTIHATEHLSAQDARSLVGTLLSTDSYDVLSSGEDADVYKPTGEPLLKYRHHVIPSRLYAPAPGGPAWATWTCGTNSPPHVVRRSASAPYSHQVLPRGPASAAVVARQRLPCTAARPLQWPWSGR
jgi:hypothetical protein